MAVPPPDEPTHWMTTEGQQVGPEPFSVVTLRVGAGQIPPSTLVWWATAPTWMTYDEATAPQSATAPVAPSAPEAFTSPDPAPATEPPPEARPEPQPEPRPDAWTAPVAAPGAWASSPTFSTGDAPAGAGNGLPVTEPAASAPVAEVPADADPPMWATVTNEPPASAPVYEAPAYEAPAYEAPAYESPAAAANAPVHETPAAFAPAPTYEAPAAYEPPASFGPGPSFEPAPTFEPAPAFEPTPAQDPAPAGDPSPAQEPTPGFAPLAEHSAPAPDTPPSYEPPAAYEPPAVYEPPATAAFAAPLAAQPPTAFEPAAFEPTPYEATPYEPTPYEPPVIAPVPAPGPAGADEAAPSSESPLPDSPLPQFAPAALATAATAATATVAQGVDQPAPAEPEATPPGDPSATAILGHHDAPFTSAELDDEFVSLVARSEELHRKSAAGSAVDEAILAAMIAALVDSGYVLIDFSTDGASTGSSVNNSGAHHLRFEEPEVRSRVSIALEVPALLGDTSRHAPAQFVVGYSEQVPNFNQVGQALRQEVASAFVVSASPGTVTFDAEIASGYVTAKVDLLLELDPYIGPAFEIDHVLIRRQLSAIVHTLQNFTRARFGN